MPPIYCWAVDALVPCTRRLSLSLGRKRGLWPISRWRPPSAASRLPFRSRSLCDDWRFFRLFPIIPLGLDNILKRGIYIPWLSSIHHSTLSSTKRELAAGSTLFSCMSIRYVYIPHASVEEKGEKRSIPVVTIR